MYLDFVRILQLPYLLKRKMLLAVYAYDTARWNNDIMTIVKIYESITRLLSRDVTPCDTF